MAAGAARNYNIVYTLQKVNLYLIAFKKPANLYYKPVHVHNARKTLSKLKRCALEAGIYHSWFLSFGTLLGAIRPSKLPWGEGFKYQRGLIDYDDDMDVGILSDRITKDQEQAYIELIRKAGLFGWDERRQTVVREKYQYREDNGRLLWMSLRPSPPPGGTKCCNWFWTDYHGYYWHSKGADWVDPTKGKFRKIKTGHRDTDQAVMLGIPKFCLDELMEITFYDEKYNVPVMYGHCLDWWYPKWIQPQERCSSARAIHCVVGRWDDESTWRIC